MMKTILVLLVCAIFAHAQPLLPGFDLSGPVPGLNMGFGAGYDVKTERIRMPLFQYTYNDGNVWRNPQNGIEYQYPDQLFLTEVPKGKVVKEVTTFIDYHQYIKAVTTTMGISIGVSYGGIDAMINFQRSQGKYNEICKSGVNNFGLENRFMPIFQLDLWPDAEYNSHLQTLIKNLPNTISSPADQQKYDQFIQAAGTHYCVSAQFGGYLNFTSIFQSSMYKERTATWVSFQVGLSVSWQEIKVGIDVGRNSSIDKMDQYFREHSYNETNCVGGQCYLLDNGNYDKWMQTVVSSPGMIPSGQTMYEITELVWDNPTKKQTLRNAVIEYLKKPM